MKYKNIDIVINGNKEESEKHIKTDYQVLIDNGIESIIKKQFIPWLLENGFEDKDSEKVFEGLRLYSISYYYDRVVAEYSPTGKEDYFGQFEFCFESDNDYTKDILEAVAMQVYVLDNKIAKVCGYDI